MEKFSKAFFSMRMMAVGMFIFLFAIGSATIYESLYDIQTARILVYNALWFEILLVYLCINLLVNIFRYRMFRRDKLAMLFFHLAFIVMLIGAAITRYISFEGMMIIKEGASSNFIYSAEPQLWIKVHDGKKQYTYQKQLYLSEHTSNDFKVKVDFPGHANRLEISYKDFGKDLVDSVVSHDSIPGYALELVTSGMESNFLFPGEALTLGDLNIAIGENPIGIAVYPGQDGFRFQSPLPLRSIAMSAIQAAGGQVNDSLYVTHAADSIYAFNPGTLYATPDGNQFVYKELRPNTAKIRIKGKQKGAGSDYLTLLIKDGDKQEIVEMRGGKDAIPEHLIFEFNGLTYEMEYGSIRIPIPFSVACRDFQLDRYPGSESPSSFASEVTIIDKERNVTKDHRIFMNNVMDYRGYRFFQSSYEPDESGTRLSVNHDFWGTTISYLGYLMMGLGMILNLIAPGSRFRELNDKLRKSREMQKKMMLIALLLIAPKLSMAEEHDHQHDHKDTHVTVKKEKATFRVITEAHSESLASLMVQDYSGRIIPFHTLADQLLRKLTRSQYYGDYNAVQTIMSMHMHPDYWMDQPIIYVSTKGGLREKLKVDASLISFNRLNDADGNFVLLEDYRKAHQMLESKRGEYEKQLIKLAEKYEVAQSIFNWRYMKIIPHAADPKHTWHSPLNLQLLEQDTSGIKAGIRYLAALDEATNNNRLYRVAEERLDALKKFQREEGKAVAPPEKTIMREIRYNKMGVFKKTYQAYLSIGFIALILYFIRIFRTPTAKRDRLFKGIAYTLSGLSALVFLYHGYGLYLRWMISGHAPWSNGYEAILFIAWATVLTGLLFARKNAIVVGATVILAALMIYVSEMNLMDPEITPLQPVLKSYWLMIHVAVITGSYGPLGISAILGAMSLLLYLLRTKKNGHLLTIHINELAYISEMTMTIGVFLLSIGTFLGGIWANESWGRYWGWDPKETWALVAILVYGVILHLRFIPGLNGKFLFHVLGFWGYSSILFTFFGVNFYLVGLHSYAQGEGLGKFPDWIIYTAIGLVLFTALAAFRNRQYKSQLK